MKNRNLRIILSLVVLLIVGLRFGYRYMKHQKQAQQAELVKQVEMVNKANSGKNTNEGLNGIVEMLKQYKSPAADYDKFFPIDDEYGLGIKADKYYIVDVPNEKATLLDKVTNAYVLYIYDEDNDNEFNGLFVQKDNNWYLVDEQDNGEVVVDLSGTAINDKSKFVIKNSELHLVDD